MRRTILGLLLGLTACGRLGDTAPWDRQDEHAPVAVDACPADEATGVSPGVRPRVQLAFPGEAVPDLDAATLSARSVTLISSEQFRLAGEVGWDPDTGVVLFEPSSTLAPYVRYEIAMTDAVRDLLGNPVTGELRASFVTAEEDTGDPCAGWTGTPGSEEEP